MTTNLERDEIRKKHMHQEAAQVIAEAFPVADQVVTKDFLEARLGRLEASMHRWMLTYMATQFLGLAGMIVAVLMKT